MIRLANPRLKVVIIYRYTRRKISSDRR